MCVTHSLAACIVKFIVCNLQGGAKEDENNKKNTSQGDAKMPITLFFMGIPVTAFFYK